MSNTNFHLSVLEDWNRIPELQEVFRQGLGETDESYWLWKYQTDNGMQNSKIIFAENSNKKIVGFAGLQPLEYVFDKEVLTLVQMQDLVIVPECRGSGLMRALYFYAFEYCKNQGFDAFIQHPNENSFHPFVKFGSCNMGEIGSISTKTNLLHNLTKRKQIKQLKYRDWDYLVDEKMPDDIFFNNDVNESKLKKSKQFYKWRYEINPDERFYWLTIRNKGILCGYLIFSIINGRINKAVNIADYEFLSMVPEDAFKKSIDILRTYGTLVSLWGLISDEDNEKFKKAGLIKTNIGNSHFMIHPYDEDTNIPKKWRITRSDLDF